jgi:hypothetical protein
MPRVIRDFTAPNQDQRVNSIQSEIENGLQMEAFADAAEGFDLRLR